MRSRTVYSLLFLFLVIVDTNSAWCQTAVLTSQGVSGDMDSRKRDPVLTVRRVVSESSVKLLADAHVPNPDYRQYPIRFDFYVNRRLFSSQIRSNDLPGPVGVDIGSNVATPPFNFSVLAQIVHPNRTFSTLLNASVFNSNLQTTLDCTLSLNSGESTTAFVANDVETLQSGDDTFSINFNADEVDGDDRAAVSGIIKNSSNSGTASLRINRDDVIEVIPVNGPLAFEDSNLTSINLTSSDGNTALVCS